MGNKKCFTEKDFQVELVKPELEVGLEVVWEGKKGKIIKMEGYGHTEPIFKKEDYLIIELEKPDEYNCKILEVRKELFNYLIYPRE
jgi:hypothetical protein